MMHSHITETIFNGKTGTIAYTDVSHIEFWHKGGIFVITDKTKWNFENDCWENAFFVTNNNDEDRRFLSGWCNYVAERDGMLSEGLK